MPKLGNKNIATREDPELSDPSAAAELLTTIQGMHEAKRRVIFFCACKAPAGPGECHRLMVSALLTDLAKKGGLSLAVEEWPGGHPSGAIDVVCETDEPATSALHAQRAWMPLPSGLELATAAGLPWGAILRLGTAEGAPLVLRGRARFEQGNG
jgi:hypothetical protein